MSSFAGYDSTETSTYLGTQCHGVMWPETAQLPAAWPICPPIVSGKVSCRLPGELSVLLPHLWALQNLQANREQWLHVSWMKWPTPYSLLKLRRLEQASAFPAKLSLSSGREFLRSCGAMPHISHGEQAAFQAGPDYVSTPGHAFLVSRHTGLGQSR